MKRRCADRLFQSGPESKRSILCVPRLIANITNSVGTNTELKTCVNNILNNQAIIPHVNTLCTTPELQTLMYSLKSDNILMNNVKNLVLNHTQSTININS